MFLSFSPSTVADQTTLIAGACFAVLAVVCVFYRRLQVQNHRLSTALNNMSQGLNMFDAQGRITLLNRRYLDMYKLSPEIVNPGCTLKRLIEYRKETGLFAGEVDSYVKNILDAMAQGKSYVKASDGRIVLAKNEPLPAAAGLQRTKMSPNNVGPNRNVPPFATRSTGAQISMPPSHRLDPVSSNCSPP